MDNALVNKDVIKSLTTNNSKVIQEMDMLGYIIDRVEVIPAGNRIGDVPSLNIYWKRKDGNPTTYEDSIILGYLGYRVE